MKKWLVILLVVIIAAGGYWYWQSGRIVQEAPKNSEVSLINPVGPTVIPIIGLDKGKVVSEIPVKVSYWKNNDDLVGSLSKGDVNFAVIPITQAANLYAKQKDMVLLGVHEWKVFYMAAASNSAGFSSWSSLNGRTVYTHGNKGQTVDVLLRAALSKNNIKPDEDVKIVYAAPQEIVQLFQAGKVEYAALPEPYATAAIQGNAGQIVLDFQKVWAELSGGPEIIPVAGLFVKKSYLNSHPEETAKVEKAFIDSLAWGNQNPDQAIDLSKETLAISPEVMRTALPRIDFHYSPVRDAKSEVDAFLKKMNELYSPSLPTVPDKEFYAS